MPSNTLKSAAVPFVNKKGERSMKRVKVERYVAGKKPAYAREEDDQDDEYYATDEEDEEYEDEEDEDDDYQQAGTSNRRLGYDDSSSSGAESSSSDSPSKVDIKKADKHDHSKQEAPRIRDSEDEQEAEDDDDDPRFRRLKQLESKTNVSKLIDVQRTQLIQPKYELKNVVIEEEDDEEEIRQRHALARKRQLDEPTARLKSIVGPNTAGGPQLASGDPLDEDDDEADSQDEQERRQKSLDTDDLLKDFKLTGISRSVREKLKTEEEEREEARRLKEMIEQAKQEAAFTNQTYKKIDEDIKKETEQEALAKGDIGAREMTSVNTDDEDDELAYEEWKLREIKRVLRDRSERMLAASNIR